MSPNPAALGPRRLDPLVFCLLPCTFSPEAFLPLASSLKPSSLKSSLEPIASCLESSLPCLPASNPLPLGRVYPPYNPSLGTPLELIDITRREINQKTNLKKDTQKVTRMSPRGLQSESKIHPKWKQEGVKITLGSHLAKKHEKLNFGCYLLYFRHVGPPPKPSKLEPCG